MGGEWTCKRVTGSLMVLRSRVYRSSLFTAFFHTGESQRTGLVVGSAPHVGTLSLRSGDRLVKRARILRSDAEYDS